MRPLTIERLTAEPPEYLKGARLAWWRTHDCEECVDASCNCCTRGFMDAMNEVIERFAIRSIYKEAETRLVSTGNNGGPRKT